MHSTDKKNLERLLIVVSTEEETCGEIEGVPLLLTGVGKINATMALTQYIVTKKLTGGNLPQWIINYGTAGSHIFSGQQLIDCTGFIQRDMDVTSLGYKKGETPFDGGHIVLNFEDQPFNPIGKKAVCGTGDSFVDVRSDDGIAVIDMEAYALAKVCTLYNIPFIAFKYIISEAGGMSHGEWRKKLISGIALFKKLVLNHITKS